MKSIFKILTLLICCLVCISCNTENSRESSVDNAKDTVPVSALTDNDNTKSTEIPELCGEMLDVVLQEKLMNDGFLLSVSESFSDSVPSGVIISQKPEGKTVSNERGILLELEISKGSEKTDIPDESNGTDITDSPPDSDKASSNAEPKWIIAPTIDYDTVETFGKTGYSICSKWNTYGIIDMNGQAYGTGDYTKLFHCPEHGLSSPDVTQSVKLADNLSVAPDCGYDAIEQKATVYVYDDSRSKVYVTGYSNGVFRIADITETDFFKSNERYIAVLYNCDADLMMYEGAGMESLADIFKAENRDMKYGVISNNMEHLIGFVYDEIRDGNDCYIVKQNGLYGYRGTVGQYYYPCIFTEANTAYLGAAWVKYNGLWGVLAF